ncbi:MAG: hypothetical protein IAI49_04360 [Candidatus Eremiobacteraeota bacterium]|nr:hypothetical protein [Candidatus Eremiobacteraeota bacterium]
MTPVGVAIAPDGSIVVADVAAHNVRRIASGRVTTLAGLSPVGVSADERTGGFADGNAGVARFDRPVGVAVARNGDVYVADAGNMCIRKISHGIVTTFSGSRAPGHADGGPRSAQFGDLKGIAIDDAGMLYVADYGGGLRRVDTGGNVTTLTKPNDPKTVVDVSVSGAAERAIVAYGDATHFHLLVNGKTQDVAYVDVREPGLSELSIGRADGIAIVNENTLAVADASTNAVRLIRLPAPPFLTDRMSRALAGGVREGADLAGGFADGPPERALVQSPRAIALARNGTFIVADTGNRRIRAISGVDSRESVLPSGVDSPLPRKAYRIAVVGNSYAFYNVLWPESIPGRIEALLSHDAPAIGLRARPALVVYRVDDLSAAAGASLIREYLGDGQVDVIVLMLNAYGPWSAEALRALATELQAERTKLMLVYTPQGFEVSPLDFPEGDLASNVDFSALRAEAVKSETFYNRTGIQSVLLLDQMESWESRLDRRPLFYGADHHFTTFGSQWVGERIAEALERWRPWRTR